MHKEGIYDDVDSGTESYLRESNV